MRNSSHIQQFVVLSEEAIAKGVRRIIAVTGTEAVRATGKADKLDQEVKELSSRVQTEVASSDKTNVQALGKEIVSLVEQVNQSQIACWRKEKLRQQIEVSRKSLLDLEKANKAAMLADSLELCKKFAEENPGVDRVVKEVVVGGEAKSLNETLKCLRVSLPESAIMLFSVDKTSGKLLCLSSIPNSKKEKLKANEWLNEITPLMGAKGGGRDTQAQATGTNVTSLTECIDVANKFAELKLA